MNIERFERELLLQPTRASPQSPPQQMRKGDHPSDGVSGKHTDLIGGYPYATWNPTEASPRSSEHQQAWAQVNTPRILELDINRMLIGQNQISLSIPPLTQVSKDRLANAASLSTRTYATLSRPAGQESRSRGTNRPKSASSATCSTRNMQNI